MTQQHHKNSHLLKMAWLVAVLFLVILFIAVVFVLFVTVRLQRSILTKSPVYTARELYNTAQQQITSGNYEQAEDYLKQALLKEDDSTYRNQLAVVEYRLKKYSLSVAQYQKLIDLHKDEGFAWNGIGNAYRDWATSDTLHRVEYKTTAEHAYRSAIAADPHYVAAYSNLALMLYAAGNLTGAISVLNEGYTATGQSELQKLTKNMQIK